MLAEVLTTALPSPRPAAAGPPQPLVRLDGVTRRFGSVPALDGVDLEVHPGEVLGIIGRSGAGKSTLVRVVNGLERVDSGTITVEGRTITGLGERELQPVRRRIGMIFQHFNLLANRTVAQNVALPLEIAGWPRAKRGERVAELLELIGLADKAERYPAQLSGGQKQRVGIARALAAAPSLLLSDEATSALDPETTVAILDLLRDLKDRLGLTILLITHEMDVIRRIADRVAVMDQGRIVEEGPVRDVFASPRSATTRSLLRGVRPELPVALREKLHDAPDAFAVLEVHAAGDQARAPILAELALQQGIAARLLHGGIDRVAGEPFATLFLAVPTRPAGSVERAVEHLRPRVSHLEVVGHVAGDA